MPRLDRFISSQTGVNRRQVRLLLAQGRVEVDGVVARDISQVLGRFQEVRFDGALLQSLTPRYLMLNKPRGVVCATRDARHITVSKLLTQTYRDQLHIAGRLDFNSTGLVLLTNDGQWSRRLSLPQNNCWKRYRVTTEKPLSQAYVTAFEQGMHFAYEGVDLRPASLTLLGEYEAEVALVEGRYHQIKRMFGRFNNRVLSLHRFAVGAVELGPLPEGESRELTSGELQSLHY